MAKKSVLLIEDIFEFRKSFVSYFNQTDEWVLVAQAPSPRKAIKILNDFSPDLILCRDYLGASDFLDQIPEAFWKNRGVMIQYHTSGSTAYFDSDTRKIREQVYDIALVMRDARIDEKKLNECLISVLNGRPLALASSSDKSQVVDSSEIAEKIIAIGSSAGGPRVLKMILEDLPVFLDAAVLIVQHIPATFSDTLVQSIKSTSVLPVNLAENGMVVKKNNVYIAPGGFHMLVKHHGVGGQISLNTDAPKWNLRPCIDRLFESLPAVYGHKGVAVILTGLGNDGTEGAKVLKSNGFKILVQDKETSMVYGMPAAVVEAGICDQILPDTMIPKVASAYIARL